MTDQNREEESQISEILRDASAYNMRWEVERWAQKEINENSGLSKIDAYVTAYNEWIK